MISIPRVLGLVMLIIFVREFFRPAISVTSVVSYSLPLYRKKAIWVIVFGSIELMKKSVTSVNCINLFFIYFFSRFLSTYQILQYSKLKDTEFRWIFSDSCGGDCDGSYWLKRITSFRYWSSCDDKSVPVQEPTMTLWTELHRKPPTLNTLLWLRNLQGWLSLHFNSDFI